MSKKYYFAFGSGNPQTYSGLNPTMISFIKFDGTTLAPLALTEPVTNQGIYQFTYTPSFSAAFIIDGATNGLTTSDRYIFGSVDPIDLIDELGSTLFALGTTGVALGTSGVALGTSLAAQGSTLFAIGTTNVALGTSNIALGTSSVALGTTILSSITSGAISGIGSTASSYGTNLADPVDLFGYLKRIQELIEGNESFSKASGSLQMLSRGSSQLLRTKTITNDAIGVTKS